MNRARPTLDHVALGAFALTHSTPRGRRLPEADRTASTDRFGGHEQPPAGLPSLRSVASLTAVMRADLGIPRYTTATVRRRVGTLVVRRANALVLPLAGLVLTGLAVPQASRLGLAALFVVTTALSIFIPLIRFRPRRRR